MERVIGAHVFSEYQENLVLNAMDKTDVKGLLQLRPKPMMT